VVASWKAKLIHTAGILLAAIFANSLAETATPSAVAEGAGGRCIPWGLTGLGNGSLIKGSAVHG
jgi:hypothetical protein